MSSKKVLCCADLHLGRSSAWLAGPTSTDRSSAGAWSRIVEEALTAGANAVAIAGDVFDGVAAYYETRAAFQAGLLRLRDAGIPTVAVAGNHDFDALPRFLRAYPDSGLTLLGRQGEWETALVGGITFVGWSFPSDRYVSNAFHKFSPPTASGPVVGLVHGDLDPLSPYHPMTAGDVAVGADAWVLGHIHRPQRVGARAVYPGSPQALDFGPGERGVHGCYWLSLEGGTATFSDLVPISTVRFEETELVVDVPESEETWESMLRSVERFADDCRAVQPNLVSVQLRVRTVLSGCTALPKVSSEHEPSRDGRDAVVFSEVRLRPMRDLWVEERGRDAAGEIARLLLGATAQSGKVGDRDVNPDWIALADDLVLRGAEDVQAAFRSTIAGVRDAGDAARIAPDIREAKRIARAALVAELEDLLGQTEARREEVPA